MAGCATANKPAVPSSELKVSAPLDPWLKLQEQRSWAWMQRNISPTEPKVAGGAKPEAGIIVAALSKKDPDYYFHWTRDSAHVVDASAEVVLHRRDYVDLQDWKKKIHDFLVLSRKLQTTPSKYGMGEPRFTVEGKADTLPWSRPQYDGPALRALAVMKVLNVLEAEKPKDQALIQLARQVLKTDLDYVAKIWPERGFDIWEEYRGENYHTRLVQLAALEQGQHYFKEARYQSGARELRRLLDDHWDPARGFLRSQLVIAATDGYTAKKTDLDSAVIVAVVEANREVAAHSVLDDRVQASVAVLEDLFRKSYPTNARTDVGLAYGRYPGDSYYGGNPWFLITADYAQFYFRLALRLAQGASLPVTSRNIPFLKSLLPNVEWRAGTEVTSKSVFFTPLVEALQARGEAILRRLQREIPADGQIYEQFDKVTGHPASSPGIGWGHAAFLEAALAYADLRAFYTRK